MATGESALPTNDSLKHWPCLSARYVADGANAGTRGAHSQSLGDRAVVVEERCLSPRDPIRAPNGAIIGISRVGLLERCHVGHEHRLTLKCPDCPVDRDPVCGEP